MSGWFCVNRASVIVWGRSRKRALHGFRPFGLVAVVTARALLGLARSVAVVAAPRAGLAAAGCAPGPAGRSDSLAGLPNRVCPRVRTAVCAALLRPRG
jgi:hypothetical protein